MKKHILALCLLPLLSAAYCAEQPSTEKLMIYSNPEGIKEIDDTAGYYHDRDHPDFKLVKSDRADGETGAAALLLVGTPAAFPLLKREIGDFPVEFSTGGFTFGGRYYTGASGLVIFRNDGVRPVEMRASSAWQGAWTTFYLSSDTARGIISAAGDAPAYFVIFPRREGALVLRKGAFVKTPEGFRIDAAKDVVVRDDPRAEYERKMLTYQGRGVTYHYLPGSWAEKNIKKLSSGTEKDLAELDEYLGLSGSGKPVAYYLYESREEKGLLTGITGNAHADKSSDKMPEVHAIYSRDLCATGVHEFVHLRAFQAWGRERSQLMSEGLAVALTKNWNGKPFPYWAALLRKKGAFPSLITLSTYNSYWSKNSSDAYALAGHFVDFLLKDYGKEKVKEFYLAPFTDESALKIFGAGLEQIEKRWLAQIDLESAAGETLDKKGK